MNYKKFFFTIFVKLHATFISSKMKRFTVSSLDLVCILSKSIASTAFIKMGIKITLPDSLLILSFIIFEKDC